MAQLTKRATIYFDPAIHRVLKVKSAETEHSISEIINDVLRHGLSEDREDLAVISKRAKEPTVSYESLLK